MKDYYKILGLSYPATFDEVQSSYWRHYLMPNVGIQNRQARRDELNEAYSVLGNPDFKRIYDLLYPNRNPNTKKHTEKKQSAYVHQNLFTPQGLSRKMQDCVRVLPLWMKVVVAITLLLFVCLEIKTAHEVKISSENVTKSFVLDADNSYLLEGLYAVKIIDNEGKSYVSAEIRLVDDRECIVTLYSDFDPLILTGKIQNDGIINIDDMGKGKIMYTPASDKINITFKNPSNHRICVFSK